MGIQGLLKSLQPAMRPIDITEEYANQNMRVGIGSLRPLAAFQGSFVTKRILRRWQLVGP
jgi:hypothetical protein